MLTMRSLGLLLLLLLFVVSCSTSNIDPGKVQIDQVDVSSNTQMDGGDEVNLYDLREYLQQNSDNLKGIDKSSGKKNVEVILDNVCDYPRACKQFIYADEYADFKLVEQGINDTIASANYRHKENPNLGDYDAYVNIYLYETKQQAHATVLNYLEFCASDTVLPISTTGINVGDLGIGSSDSLVFIRGNVFVEINGYDNISIVNLAQEIDSQILKIITE
ncbi:MAG: hypothetical protein FWH57_02315 [Oscillospiraceae bacterium]|nr:hypothetical protein [Oscillospiraceae bacterium]